MSEEINQPIEKTKLTSEEKENFFKAFRADKPYMAKEKIFNNLEVEFRTLNSAETDAIYHQLRKEQENGNINNDSSYLMALSNYRLSLSLISLDKSPYLAEVVFDSYKPKDDKDSYVLAKANPIKNWPTFKLAALTEVFKSFEDKVFALTKAIHDQDFWKAAA